MAILSLLLVGVLLFPEHSGFIGVLVGIGLLGMVIVQRFRSRVRYRRSVPRRAFFRGYSLVPQRAMSIQQAKFKPKKFRKASVFRI